MVQKLQSYTGGLIKHVSKQEVEIKGLKSWVSRQEKQTPTANHVQSKQLMAGLLIFVDGEKWRLFTSSFLMKVEAASEPCASVPALARPWITQQIKLSHSETKSAAKMRGEWWTECDWTYQLCLTHRWCEFLRSRHSKTLSESNFRNNPPADILILSHEIAVLLSLPEPYLSARERQQCSGGPCRVDRSQAQEDAEKMEEKSVKGGRWGGGKVV